MRVLVQTLLFVSAIAIPAVSAVAETAQNAPFKVGVIVALSGGGAYLGESVKNGITMAMAMDKLPAADRAKLEILYEDDSLLPKNAATAFNKLVSTKSINAVITLGSGSSNAVASLAEQKHVPLIAIATDPAVVKGRNWAVNFWVTPAAETT